MKKTLMALLLLVSLLCTVLSGCGDSSTEKAPEDGQTNGSTAEAEPRSNEITVGIAQDLDDAKKLKIDGTPCFLVNGLMVRGALSEPLFEAAVDIALEAAR